MPRVDVKALQRIMLERNFLFKHQLANLVGLSYDRLTDIIANNQNEVEEEVVVRLCSGLGCERADIIASED